MECLFSKTTLGQLVVLQVHVLRHTVSFFTPFRSSGTQLLVFVLKGLRLSFVFPFCYIILFNQ